MNLYFFFINVTIKVINHKFLLVILTLDCKVIVSSYHTSKKKKKKSKWTIIITVLTPSHGCFHRSPSPPSLLIQSTLKPYSLQFFTLCINPSKFAFSFSFLSKFSLSLCIWLRIFALFRNWFDLNRRWGVPPQTPLSHVTDYQLLHSGCLMKMNLDLICILVYLFKFYLIWIFFVYFWNRLILVIQFYLSMSHVYLQVCLLECIAERADTLTV